MHQTYFCSNPVHLQTLGPGVHYLISLGLGFAISKVGIKFQP